MIAGPFQNYGASDSHAQFPSSQIATTLFSNQPGALNFSLDAFVAHSGPMAWPLSGPSSFLDASIINPNNGDNIAGHDLGHICSLAVSGVDAASASPSSTITTLTAPGTAVLGEEVPLQATVAAAAGSGSVLSGTVQFRDGSTVIGTGMLDSTGTAIFSTTGFAIGTHPWRLTTLPMAVLKHRTPASATLTVYANAPDMLFSLSASGVNISYGSSSSPVTVQVASLSGLAGTVSFSCTGLPVGMTCTFSPAQPTIAAGGNTTTLLTITATAPQTAGILWFGNTTVILLFPVSLFLLWRIRRGGQRIHALLCVLLLAVVSLGHRLDAATAQRSSTIRCCPAGRRRCW